METEAPSKKNKGSKKHDGESSRLSNKRKKIYTSFGPQPQTRGNPTPPTPQTETPSDPPTASLAAPTPVLPQVAAAFPSASLVFEGHPYVDQEQDPLLDL
ncbi:hypothetical protein U1Q18_043766 [Sarracenia purpurea var. burkii]